MATIYEPLPLRADQISYGSGSDNIFIGYNDGSEWKTTAHLPDDAPATFWTCPYCGQSNAAEREGCRGCQAPRPEAP